MPGIAPPPPSSHQIEAKLHRLYSVRSEEELMRTIRECTPDITRVTQLATHRQKVCMSVHLSICLSVCLSVCLSLSLSLSLSLFPPSPDIYTMVEREEVLQVHHLHVCVSVHVSLQELKSETAQQLLAAAQTQLNQTSRILITSSKVLRSPHVCTQFVHRLELCILLVCLFVCLFVLLRLVLSLVGGRMNSNRYLIL